MDSPTLDLASARAGRPLGARSPWIPRLSIAYGILAALLGAYVIALVVHADRGPWSFVSSWGVDGFEFVVALMCLACGVLGGSPRRTATVALGLGLIAWSIGDILWSFETQNGGNLSTPSPADFFYLLFYPLACVAVILLMRREVEKLPLTVWLDGLVTGLGAATVVAAFAFETIWRGVSGPTLTVATLVAYPIGDLILLAVVVAALAMLPTWRSAHWLILAFGCALEALGDTVYLFQASAGTYRVGTLLDVTWPLAIFLASLAMLKWSSSPKERAPSTRHRFTLPAIGATCGLVVLFRGSLNHVSRVALVLAALTLVVVVCRLVLSFRELTTLTESRRRESLTDELTGLGNRRYLMLVLDEFFARRVTADEELRLALLLIDLDHFKEINDAFGHPVGDRILTDLGPRIRSVLQDSDLLVRLGGDEFGVVLTDANVDDATTIAERITSQLEHSFHLDVTSLYLNASIGIAVAPDHAQSSAELFRCADVAMYRAKTTRRPFDVYERTSDDGMSRMRQLSELRKAIRGPYARTLVPTSVRSAHRGSPIGRGVGAMAAPGIWLDPTGRLSSVR